jgi:hypothetical protein
MLLNDADKQQLVDVHWSLAHGAQGNHLAVGALYFALPYMLQARTCVCLGSGAGFVPLTMLAAQRQLVAEGVLDAVDVHLVDADVGPWGRPDYEQGLPGVPEVTHHKMLTNDAAGLFDRIDYLHVDADHSYEQTLADLRNFGSLCVGEHWAITVHDTWNLEYNRQPPLGSWQAAVDYAAGRGAGVVNVKVGCGTALIMKASGL